MLRSMRCIVVPLAFACASTAVLAQSAQPRVFFVAPADGAVVSNPVVVKFGVEGMTVKPAGEVVANTGHHHLIIDGDPIPAGQVVPADDSHLHFGKGQTETTVNLTPGDHALTMQFADGAHRSYGPAMSQTIKVHVKGQQ
ncbi:rod shape-determining protein RodA [Pandoraea pnomenusa]|uniref:Rod shape-determining protein RodA n=2 Tax=Pandoraea pnomenusa TaxID=93220 RepID=A0ABY6WH91_9BURK|nr:DUF4399 domain-containing protein [Pandoraea pnomenusa]ANC46055.1 rod shape-determining protein RodA [Pandoraea pnomenusa]VVE64084.1 rod shape-determining protein RodA [Pandoraea pnomenusa]